MKQITNYKFLVVFLMMSLSFGFKAQNMVSTTPASNGWSCDGSATFQNAFFYSNWTWMQDSATVLQTGGATINNLCYGSYLLAVVDSMGGTFYESFFIDTVEADPCAGFSAYVQASTTSGPGMCDASAYSSIYGGTAPYTYTWDNGMMGSQIGGLCTGTYLVTVVDANGCVANATATISDSSGMGCNGFMAYIDSQTNPTLNNCDGYASVSASGGDGNYSYLWSNASITNAIGNLCAGVYTVSVTDGNGCSVTTSAYLYSDTMYYGLTGYVYTSNASIDGACDGYGYVDVYGGTAPYNFEHSTGELTQEVYNLCAGIYSVYVTDANGDSLILNYIIANPSDIFNGNGYVDSIVVDTLGIGLVEDCIIDYLSLDTAFVSSIEYITADSILVTWSVIDGNGTINFYQSYTISSGVGVYELILQIFCPQRSGNDYVYAIDRIYFNPATMSISKKNQANLSVYPNPFTDVLHIDLGELNQANIVITDLTGKVVYSLENQNQNADLNLGFLAKGHYLVRVSNEQNTFTRVIVK